MSVTGQSKERRTRGAAAAEACGGCMDWALRMFSERGIHAAAGPTVRVFFCPQAENSDGLLPGRARAFTLIELILVMSILTIAVSVTAPRLANFFRGRTLDSEARRLLAMTRQGQSRAVSEGIPVELWVDSQNGKFGLEAEPSYEPTDAKAIEFTLESDLQLQAITDTSRSSVYVGNQSALTPVTSTVAPQLLSRHPDLPRIRFLPDGSIAETSPSKLCLTGRDGFSLWLIQSRNGLSYELSARAY